MLALAHLLLYYNLDVEKKYEYNQLHLSLLTQATSLPTRRAKT